MKISIETKFDIGQTVFICQKTHQFEAGVFVDTYTVDTTPRTVKDIIVSYLDSGPHIFYAFEDIVTMIPEYLVFSTFEEVEKWGHNYE